MALSHNILHRFDPTMQGWRNLPGHHTRYW